VGGSYTLTGKVEVEGLALLHDLMAQVGSEHPEIEPLDLSMLETAVIEIAGNVVEHGTPPDGVRFEFSLDVTDGHLRAQLVDTGDPVVPPPVLDAKPGGDPLAESGRGFPIALAVLDELRYEREGETNVWIMTRVRGDGQLSDPVPA
jgi:serine/threonine-protein kinase RsbW